MGPLIDPFPSFKTFNQMLGEGDGLAGVLIHIYIFLTFTAGLCKLLYISTF